MKTKHIFETDLQDVPKSAINILDSLEMEDYDDRNVGRYIARVPMRSNKKNKTLKYTNKQEDQEDEYR